MHPFLGQWGASRCVIQRTNTSSTNTAVTSSATAYNNITPVQIVASTAFDVSMISLRINTAVSATGARSSTVFDIMAGAASSEYVIAGPISVGYRSTGFTVNLPIFIPAGTRISLRVRSTRTSTTFNCQLEYAGEVNRDVSGLPQRWVAYGMSDDASANAQGTLVTPGASNVWGSWTSLTTSTTYAHELWLPMVDGGTTTTHSGRTYRSQWAIASTTDAATMVTNSTVWEGPGWTSTTAEAIGDALVTAAGNYGLGYVPNGIIYAPRGPGAAVSVRVMNSGANDTNAVGCSVLAAL